MTTHRADGPLFDEAQIGSLRDVIGHEDLLTMLQDLPPAAKKSVDEIINAVNVGDIDQAGRSAHTLKGCAGSLVRRGSRPSRPRSNLNRRRSERCIVSFRR
jgi:hypothetical protein